ncbi:acetyltransferase (GNAT) family protein [Fontibacillus phaseoli]|uniref:Acetyltransferase (GNAT) family protein n=1 Tax=Fontibacillus phaseoli TaxID=1416533 RepID=A0A369BSK6_9BACL|nr:GNAT family N-acetyltransferase [Fontibacillus phaseoli]RCX23576.1 acetyltransferase (GNAT) family protein [Fontibacillus phaseoli]
MKELLDTMETTAGIFQIGLADEDDTELVRSLLIEAATWMESSGIKQWNPEQFTEEVISSYFTNRDVYLLLRADDHDPAGLFTLQTSDCDYWGELNDEGYSYLHRLTVRPTYRGHALGRELIYWAAKRSRSLGRKGLRFDCWNENRKLNPYYRELGMEERGLGKLNGRQYILYEMDATVFQRV